MVPYCGQGPHMVNAEQLMLRMLKYAIIVNCPWVSYYCHKFAPFQQAS